MLPTGMLYPILITSPLLDYIPDYIPHDAELEATPLHHPLEGLHLRPWREVRELRIDTARDNTQITEGIYPVPCLNGTLGRMLGIPVLY